jgi:hypothetical protein
MVEMKSGQPSLVSDDLVQTVDQNTGGNIDSALHRWGRENLEYQEKCFIFHMPINFENNLFPEKMNHSTEVDLINTKL